MQRIKLHGEADDLTEEDVEAVMTSWKAELQELAEEKDVGPYCMYNADQTGLFYQKLPNSLYVQKKNKKKFKGTKQMKDKTCVTGMTCTAAADGFQLLVAIIGKAKQPVCFGLLDHSTPLPYKNQKNAWFDKQDITLWWINNVFWLEHVTYS